MKMVLKKKHLQKMSYEMEIETLPSNALIPKKRIFLVKQEAALFIATLKNSPLYKYLISLNKFYYYMPLGYPVVYGAKFFNNLVSESGAGHIVPPEGAQAIAGAMKKLAAMSSEQRIDMWRKVRDYVAVTHDMEKLARKLEPICQEVFEG